MFSSFLQLGLKVQQEIYQYLQIFINLLIRTVMIYMLLAYHIMLYIDTHNNSNWNYESQFIKYTYI